jgi:hypothetical protein
MYDPQNVYDDRINPKSLTLNPILRLSNFAFDFSLRLYTKGHLYKKRAPSYITVGADTTAVADFSYTCPTDTLNPKP